MSALSTLLTLSDSAATGGHVHSGGVEEAVASRLVVDLTTLEAYLRRRIRTSGLVTASIAAAVHQGHLGVGAAEAEPTPAHRLRRPGSPPAPRVADCCAWRGGSGPAATGTSCAPNPISPWRPAGSDWWGVWTRTDRAVGSSTPR